MSCIWNQNILNKEEESTRGGICSFPSGFHSARTQSPQPKVVSDLVKRETPAAAYSLAKGASRPADDHTPVEFCVASQSPGQQEVGHVCFLADGWHACLQPPAHWERRVSLCLCACVRACSPPQKHALEPLLSHRTAGPDLGSVSGCASRAGAGASQGGETSQEGCWKARSQPDGCGGREGPEGLWRSLLSTWASAACAAGLLDRSTRFNTLPLSRLQESAKAESATLARSRKRPLPCQLISCNPAPLLPI